MGRDKMKAQWLVPIVLIVIGASIAGCLGGDSEGGGEPQYEVKSTGMQLANNEQGLAQASPVQLPTQTQFNLEFDNVIKLTVNITVEDGDLDTDPDQVGEITLDGGENNTATVPGGNTPVTQSITIEAEEGSYLSMNWTVSFIVTINGSPDQWPGPIIWRGIPDRGYSYVMDISYDFHDMTTEL